MPDDIDTLLHRLIDGDAAAAEILDRVSTSSTPALLVAAALLTDEPAELLARAAQNAVTTRDRQLVAVVGAHLNNADEALDVLVSEHLSDFPDNVIVAWIAAKRIRTAQPTRSILRSSDA